MSYIPGTEYRMIPKVAPSAAHSKNYNKNYRRHATSDRDFKLLNMMYQTPQLAKQLHANIALRQNFLNQQESSNALNEIERLRGRLSTYRDPTLNDGRALTTRITSLEKRMTQLKPQPLAGPEGLYLY
jgi:hypothetical protein